MGSTNYAGPALLFVGVLEQLTRTTIYPAANPPGASKDKKRTLGGIAYFRAQIEPEISPAHWNKGASPLLSKFSVWVNNSVKLARIRNHAAHEGYLPETEFKELLNLYFGGLSSGGHGLFNGLLLAWQA